LGWAPGLTSTEWKLHPCLECWFCIVLAVAMGVGDSARHNTSPGRALHIPSRSVNLIPASSGFLCID
jgi:hypothetical protein